MKHLLIVSAILLLSSGAYSQRYLGPWTVTQEDGNTRYSIRDCCQIVIDENRTALGIEVMVKQHFSPSSSIRERALIDFSEAKPKVMLQESWYESDSDWGIKRTERHFYRYDEGTKSSQGRLRRFLFVKYSFQEEFKFLPKEIQSLLKLLW